jgi:hypothetical protein
LHLQIGPPSRTPWPTSITTTTTTAKKRFKDIFQFFPVTLGKVNGSVAKVKTATATGTTTAKRILLKVGIDTGVTVLIVQCPFRFVAQYLVGFRDFLEAGLGGRVALGGRSFFGVCSFHCFSYFGSDSIRVYM